MKAELFKKYIRNECSVAEIQEIMDWFRVSSGNLSDKEIIRNVWEKYDAKDENFSKIDFDYILDKIHHEIHLRKSAKIAHYPFTLKTIRIISAKVAAVLFIPLLILFAIQTIKKNRTSDGKFIEIAAPTGSLVYSELPDGTVFWLNHNSKLKYPSTFDGAIRKVYLEGEGFFKVAHNHDKPFIVEAKKNEIVALGTEFNIRAYPESQKLETCLINGKVEVRTWTGKAFQPVCTMVPGSRMVLNLNNKSFTNQTENLETYTSWKEGKLIFKSADLKEVLTRIGDWNNVDFILENSDLENLTFTATFVDENLNQMLDLLEIAAPVKFRIINREKLPDGTFTKKKIYVSRR